jgi:hypothetical protein
MKKIAILCLLLSSLCVRADMVITDSVDMGERNMTMTMKIKGDKIRVDAVPQMSTVTDTATGDTLTILHEQKSYMTISGEQAKALKDQIKKFKSQPTTTGTAADKPKLVDTGKSEKVGPFNTEIYTIDTPSTKLTFWATKDIPNYALLQEQFRKLRTMSNQGPAANLAPDTSDLQGFPVKMQVVSKGKTVTTTILSAEEKPIDDAEMAPPAGYTKISMPGFGGASPRLPRQ